MIMGSNFQYNPVFIFKHYIKISLVIWILPQILRCIFIIVMKSRSSINMSKNQEFSLWIFIKLILKPDELVFCFWTNIFCNLINIVFESVERKNTEFIRHINSKISSIHKSIIYFRCKLFVGGMIFKPELVDKIIEVSFFTF